MQKKESLAFSSLVAPSGTKVPLGVRQAITSMCSLSGWQRRTKPSSFWLFFFKFYIFKINNKYWKNTVCMFGIHSIVPSAHKPGTFAASTFAFSWKVIRGCQDIGARGIYSPILHTLTINFFFNYILWQRNAQFECRILHLRRICRSVSRHRLSETNTIDHHLHYPFFGVPHLNPHWQKLFCAAQGCGMHKDPAHCDFHHTCSYGRSKRSENMKYFMIWKIISCQVTHGKVHR